MNRKVIISIIVLLAGILACEVPPGMTPMPVVVTQVVVAPNQAVQPLPTIPKPSATVTLASIGTGTSTSTATATTTTSVDGPSITLIKNANCRNGAGTKFDVVTSYLKGDTLKIIGRNPDFDNTWWQVEMPTGGKCWVSLATGQATGPYDDIPTVVP